MNYTTPKCFKNFKCIAGACKDNCCIGWEIDIDEETMAFFDSLSGPLKDRLVSGIERSTVPHFILCENDRCPFLNSDNLCDIIIEHGEEKIPYICRNHPRFYTWLPDRTEVGMGIGCEVAAELVLKSDEPLDIDVPYDSSDSLSDTMSYARDVAYSILKNRSVSFTQRLAVFWDFCCSLDSHLFFEDTEKIKETADLYKKSQPSSVIPDGGNISELLKLYSSLEPIDESWTSLIDELTKTPHIESILKEFFQNNTFCKYENLAVYLTYRHFLNCIDTLDVISAGKFIILGTLFCGICDGVTKETDKIKYPKLYSKQVEYSQDNMDAVFDADISDIKSIIPVVFGR